MDTQDREVLQGIERIYGIAHETGIPITEFYAVLNRLCVSGDLEWWRVERECRAARVRHEQRLLEGLGLPRTDSLPRAGRVAHAVAQHAADGDLEAMQKA